MDALHAQKENVDANAGAGVASAKQRLSAGSNTFATPKRGLGIHSDAKPSKKGLKERSTKKSRRVLGDISNKHRNRQTDDANGGGAASVRKSGLGKGDGLAKTPSSRKTPKPKLAPTEAVPDIEVAYGGLSSPKADATYFHHLREELANELANDTTPTLFDDFDPTVAYGNWDDETEKKLLETGAAPSPWWTSPARKDKKESAGNDSSTESKAGGEEEVPLPLELPDDGPDDLPDDLPDELPDDPLESFDDVGLLEDLVSVDVEAVDTE